MIGIMTAMIFQTMLQYSVHMFMLIIIGKLSSDNILDDISLRDAITMWLSDIWTIVNFSN